jgi:hypothetical protein
MSIFVGVLITNMNEVSDIPMYTFEHQNECVYLGLRAIPVWHFQKIIFFGLHFSKVYIFKNIILKFQGRISNSLRMAAI